MGKTKREVGSATELSFHKHYSARWGHKRWHNSLYPALARPTRYAALENTHVPHSAFRAALEDYADDSQFDRVLFPSTSGIDDGRTSNTLCYIRRVGGNSSEDNATNVSDSNLLPPPTMARIEGTAESAMTHWNLDAASGLAVHVLNVRPGDNVLDLCAAPGGKSIALAQKLWPRSQGGLDEVASMSSVHGSLCSNETDPARSKRLEANLRAYLPAHMFGRKQVTATHVNGTDPLAARKLSIGSVGYEKVLVDAPCSSERHIVHAHIAAQAAGKAATELTNWRPGSSKRLAQTQLELLITALKAVKVGGTVLYATCSVEMTENDGVVEKVVNWATKESKKGARWTIKLGLKGGDGDAQLEDQLEKDWADKTKYGWIVLPDHPAGGRWGPLFFAMITKVPLPAPVEAG